MFTRSLRAGAGTAVLAVAVLAVSGAPALADPVSTPDATALVGVGSDTSQFAVDYLADGTTVSGSHVNGYNDTAAAGSPRLASFDACTVAAGTQFPCTPGGNITLRSGGGAGTTIPRPNGSGAGKGLLYGSGNNDNVTFARSSSALNTAEANAGLYAYPFAMDTLVMVVSKHTATHAPLNLTGDQILKIYTGEITNWSQIDPAKSGTIAPKIPQTGSGTRSYFNTQLQNLNGGVAPTLAPSVTEVQEHDPTNIQDDADAIGPFSLGRANLAGTVQVEKGFSARRALYNVVRSTSTTHPEWNVGSTTLEPVFGSDGFICSAAARTLIEAAGFKQLKTPADGGVCGVPTNTATSNLAIYNETGTPSTTALTFPGTAATYGASATAHVAVSGAGGTPTGTVTVTAPGFTQTVSLSAGSVDVTLPANLPAGTDAVKATYAGDDTFQPSEKTVGLAVAKATVAITSKLPTVVAAGRRATGKIKVLITPTSTVFPAGTVTVKRGSSSWGTGTLTNGVTTVTLKALPKGRNTLKIVYAETANALKATLTITITQR